MVQHSALAGEDRDQPSYLGLGARAMICLNLSSRLCPDLGTLGAALPRNGARLYLHPHRTDRHGFLRLNLELSERRGVVLHLLDTRVAARARSRPSYVALEVVI